MSSSGTRPASSARHNGAGADSVSIAIKNVHPHTAGAGATHSGAPPATAPSKGSRNALLVIALISAMTAIAAQGVLMGYTWHTAVYGDVTQAPGFFEDNLDPSCVGCETPPSRVTFWDNGEHSNGYWFDITIHGKQVAKTPVLVMVAAALTVVLTIALLVVLCCPATMATTTTQVVVASIMLPLWLASLGVSAKTVDVIRGPMWPTAWAVSSRIVLGCECISVLVWVALLVLAVQARTAACTAAASDAMWHIHHHVPVAGADPTLSTDCVVHRDAPASSDCGISRKPAQQYGKRVV